MPDKGFYGCNNLQGSFITISLAFKINVVIKIDIVLQHNDFLTRWMPWAPAEEKKEKGNMEGFHAFVPPDWD